MKKRLLGVGAVVIIVAIVGSMFAKPKETPTSDALTGQVMTGINELVVGSGISSNTKVYGNVVASNLASIVASTAGVVSSLQCQPGATVKKGSVVATIKPANDLQKENSLIQQTYLQQQVQLAQGGLQSTASNLDIQALSLQNQKRVNQDQLAILQQNLTNAQKQKTLSSGDTKLQIASAERALINLKLQYQEDTDKINTSIKNTEKSLQNSIRNALTLFDQTFGVTNPGKTYNSDAYLGALNKSGKDQLKAQFSTLKERNEQFTSMDNDAARAYMTEATDFFSLASQVITDSIPDDDYLPKAKLDVLYKTFADTANALLSAKSSFDTLIASAATTKITYDTQINTAQTNLDSLKSNKSAISDLTLDGQINQLKSQINSLELSIRSVDDQIRSIGNNRNLQTQQAQSQLLNNQQSLALLQNNLQGETLFAPFDGVVKSVNVQMTNKVNGGALICQITPTTIESVKIQVFSSQQIPWGTIVYFYDDKDVLIASGNITLELPYRDTLTQNYIYEFADPALDVKEGSKLRVEFDAHFINDEVWIPLSYITPKLEGYFVKKKFREGAQEIQVEVGDIDNGTIRVLSGLQVGDVVVK